MMDIGTQAEPRWFSPEEGLWVASRGGLYLGMVERSGFTFVASDGRASRLGSYTTLEAAKLAVTAGEPVDATAPARRLSLSA